MQLDIYRSGSINLVVKPDENSMITKKIMEGERATINFTASEYVDLLVGDYITVSGVRYNLNIQPSIKKMSRHRFAYECVFENVFYDLRKVAFLSGTETDFYLTGDASFFLSAIVTNMNRAGSGWTSGTAIESEVKTLQFTNENCLAAMQAIASEFETEFHVTEGKVIHLSYQETEGPAIAYGFNKGARDITRKPIDNENIITRLFAAGSERNIPADYRDYSTRLQLPASVGHNYLENNVATYGVIESSKFWDDIYPHRTGTITNIVGGNIRSFIDTGIDFDLSDHLLTSPAVVHFNTGLLAGYEFDISAWDNATKQITINLNDQEKDIVLPNDTSKPAVGDEYVILNITMPSSYVTAAEAELQAAATDWLEKYSQPRRQYTITPDELYVSRLLASGEADPIFDLLQLITITDTDFGIDADFRIIAMTRKLVNRNQYTLDLSADFKPKKSITSTLAINKIKKIVGSAGLSTNPNQTVAAIAKKTYNTLIYQQQQSVTVDRTDITIDQTDITTDRI